MRTALIVGAALLVLAGGVYAWFATRPQPSAEEQIAAAIVDMKQAVVNKEAGAFLRHIADDYSDGSYHKKDITRLIIGGFREPGSFQVHVEPPSITVTGDTADVRLEALFWIGQSTRLENAARLNLVAEFARTRRGWQVVRARGWEPAQEAIY